MNNNDIMDIMKKGSDVMMNTYSRYPILIEKGEGVYVWDKSGKKYIDFVSGIAVNSLGYNNKKLIEKINEQSQKLIHCSNLYYNEPQIELADMLVSNSDFDEVFFCNSGAEANECALKLCRKYSYKNNKKGFDVITMNGSFHGRTYGAITMTGQQKYHKGFYPLLSGIKYVDFNDIDALKNAIDENTCAIFIEVIQGEGGIICADKNYLEMVRKICDEKDIILVFDEVQTGIGRCGTLFGYQSYGVVPDVVTLAKGLASGIPIGAVMAKSKFAKAFGVGDHASTFGGNCIATSSGTVVIDELLNGVIENVKIQGEYLKKRLLDMKNKYDIIEDVRGFGLMQGLKLKSHISSDIINECIEEGLLIVSAGSDVLRFLPPLIISKSEIDYGIDILNYVISMF